jgi:hypothetical protein
MDRDGDARGALAAIANALGHPWRELSGGGLHHAVLSWGEETCFTATLTVLGPVLRLSVFDVLEGQPELARLQKLDELNQSWRFGRVFFEPSRGRFAVAAGLPLDAGPPAPEQVAAVLDHLIAAPFALARNKAPRFSPELDAPAPGVEALAAHLKALGLNAMGREDKAQLGLRVGDAVLELALEDGLLRGTAGPANPLPHPDTAATWRLLGEMNAGLDLGSMVFDREQGRIFHLFALPLAWYPLDRDRVAWAVARGAELAGMID